MFDYLEMFNNDYGIGSGYTAFNDRIAMKLGTTKAIVIQKVHYATRATKHVESPCGSEYHYYKGRWWTEKTYEDWEKLMPYMSNTNLRRTFTALKEEGYLLCAKNMNADRMCRTLWWSVNYEKFYQEKMPSHDVSKMDSMHVSKMDSSYNIYNIYIDIEEEYKDKEYKESQTLRFLRNLGILDKTLLLSLLAIAFESNILSRGEGHPRLPDSAQTVEVLQTLLDIIHERGIEGVTEDLRRFNEAKWIKGDKHLWLFCSEKVQAWLRAEETGDYDDWALATDRVVF